jgi:hypothetical protein
MIHSEGGIFSQYMELVPTHHCDEFRYLLIYRDSPSLKSQQWPDHTRPDQRSSLRAESARVSVQVEVKSLHKINGTLI